MNRFPHHGRALLLALSASFASHAVPAADGSVPDAALGRRLLAQYQCGSCHVIPDVAAARGTLGPSLQNFGRRSYIAGELPNRTDTLVRWIMEPRALVPDTTMPSMGVSVEDARHMAAFLHGLR